MEDSHGRFVGSGKHEHETTMGLSAHMSHAVFGADETPPLPVWTEKEVKEKTEDIRKLHVKAGHPSNRALHNMLKARGVDPRMLDLALGHKGDDCMEVKLPVPHKTISFSHH